MSLPRSVMGPLSCSAPCRALWGLCLWSLGRTSTSSQAPMVTGVLGVLCLGWSVCLGESFARVSHE